MKLRIYSLAFILLVMQLSQAQTIDCIWATNVAFGDGSFGNGLALDHNNNAYVTSGNSISRLNQSGNVLWTKYISASLVSLHAVTDKKGNVYVGGTAIGGIGGNNIIYIGSDTFVYSTNPSGPDPHSFIVKYDSMGSMLWAKQIKDSIGLWTGGVTLDNDGSIYITGYYNFTSSFDTITLMAPVPMGVNLFVAKYDSSGNAVWARGFGNDYYHSSIQGNAIAADENDDIYVTGQFGGALYLDTTFIQSGTFYIAKFDKTGIVNWVKTAYETLSGSGIIATDIKTDKKGNEYITGNYEDDTIGFGSNLFAGSESTSGIFSVKYDSQGNVIWARAENPLTLDGQQDIQNSGNAIVPDSNGNVYVTGFVTDSFAFGNYSIFDHGNESIFIVNYDSLANVLWTYVANSSSTNRGFEINIGSDGHIYFVGLFYADAFTFGNILLQGNVGNPILFAAKIGPDEVANGLPNITKANLHVFPNPNNGKFIVTAPDNSILSIDVIDLMGQTVYSQTNSLQVNSCELNLSDLSSQMYFLKIHTENGVMSEKIMLQK